MKKETLLGVAAALTAINAAAVVVFTGMDYRRHEDLRDLIHPIVIKKKCVRCGKEQWIRLHANDANAFINGDMDNVDMRETHKRFIETGICPSCQRKEEAKNEEKGAQMAD